MAGRLIPYDWYDGGSNQIRKVDEVKNIYEDGFVYGDPELLEILDITMVEGDRKTALKDLNSILISESKAKKLFPKENAVGQLIILNENKENPYKIGGVMADRPANSHLQFDFMISLSGVEFDDGMGNRQAGAVVITTHIFGLSQVPIQKHWKKNLRSSGMNIWYPT